MDRGAGSFAWPPAGDETERNLLATLGRLGELSFHDVLNINRGVAGRPPFKAVSVTDLAPAAAERLSVLSEPLDDDDFRVTTEELLQITYCHRTGSSERIWAYAEFSERRACMLWWDPKHLVCGFDEALQERWSGRQDSCPEGACLHP